MIKRIIDDFKEDLEYSLDKNNINRINRLLGNTLVILTYILFLNLLIFMIINFTIYFLANFKIDYLFNGQLFNEFIKFSNLFKFNLILKYPLLYIILTIILIIFSIYIFIKHKDSYGDFNIEQQGNTRWATDEELEVQYLSVIEDPLDKYGNINWIDFRTGYPIATRIINNKYMCYIDDRPAHSLNTGSTRGGKSQVVIFRFTDILSRCKYIQDRASMVFNDPKLELYAAAGRELETNRGYDVHVINFQDTNYSIHVNLLQQVTSYWQQGLYDEAVKEARYLSEYMFSDAVPNSNNDNKFFDEASIGYLNALIIAHTEDCIKYGMPEKNNMPSIYQAHVQLKGHTYQVVDSKRKTVKNRIYLDDYFENRSDDSRAKKLYISKLVTDAVKTKDNIFMTVLNQLEIFAYEDMENISIKSDIDFLKIGYGEKPVALFIGSDEIDHSKDKLIVMLITSMYRILSRQAVFTGKCKRPVHFIWDEFGQSPFVRDLQTMVSMGAGKNLFFHLFLQSFQQLVAVYGETTALAIKENLDIQVFIKGNTTENTEEFANLIGSETYLNKTRHGATFSNDKTITEQQDGRTLVTADELRRMPKGSTLVARTDVREDKYGNSDNYDLEPFPIDNRKRKNRFRFAKDYLQDVFDMNATFNDTKKYIKKIDKNDNKKYIFNALDYTRALNILKGSPFLQNIYSSLLSYFYERLNLLNEKENINLIKEINKKIEILENNNMFFAYPIDEIFKDILDITQYSFDDLLKDIIFEKNTFINRLNSFTNQDEQQNNQQNSQLNIDMYISRIENIIGKSLDEIDTVDIADFINYITSLIINDEYSQDEKQQLQEIKKELYCMLENTTRL